MSHLKLENICVFFLPCVDYSPSCCRDESFTSFGEHQLSREFFYLNSFTDHLSPLPNLTRFLAKQTSHRIRQAGTGELAWKPEFSFPDHDVLGLLCFSGLLNHGYRINPQTGSGLTRSECLIFISKGCSDDRPAPHNNRIGTICRTANSEV